MTIIEYFAHIEVDRERGNRPPVTPVRDVLVPPSPPGPLPSVPIEPDRTEYDGWWSIPGVEQPTWLPKGSSFYFFDDDVLARETRRPGGGTEPTTGSATAPGPREGEKAPAGLGFQRPIFAFYVFVALFSGTVGRLAAMNWIQTGLFVFVGLLAAVTLIRSDCAR